MLGLLLLISTGVVLVGLLIFAVIYALGAAERVLGDYSQVALGMTETEVVRIMGNPYKRDVVDESNTNLVWMAHGQEVTVNMRYGLVCDMQVTS